ncbi:SMC family ATPase [Spongiactinospora rosea]|uniref:Nuclease SbcCD subunit C n=1 Tax=Spongiactinospora rosea TaxID=2248750 RepID=A0A366LLV1_9ACTN|nr:SMC family ATPase [Spongiactinospora rosea]RBQ14483.1 SMC family ATPase [Spongiactinospora rosea]
MRLLQLSLTGLRSYPAPVTIDFTGKSLVAALGDTGAGKTSLLDAITYALFRTTSWETREARQRIADGAQAMSVELTFIQGAQHWHVQRTLHVTNPNAARHHLRNLHTGEELDNAVKVDERIKAILQMGYKTFMRVGLLAQGRFDQLLTAGQTERSRRLRELFGIESLESVQKLAGSRYITLQSLIGAAEGKRTTMPLDPRQAATAAGAAADAAEARAAFLNTAIDRISALQTEAVRARSMAETAATAAEDLSARGVANADAVLHGLEPIAADIAARRDLLNRRGHDAVRAEEQLTKAIADAGDEELRRSAVILEDLAARAEEHRGERDRLAKLNRRLATDGAAIAAAESDLATRAANAEPLAHAAEDAAETSKRVRTSAAIARPLVALAATAARAVAGAALKYATAVGTCETARHNIGILEGNALAIKERAAIAARQLDTLLLRDQAAGLAAGLHPGDGCPVCKQSVPADFTPTSESYAAELHSAKERLREATVAQDEIFGQLVQARAALTTADQAKLDRERDHQRALQDVQEAQIKAAAALKDFAALVLEAEGDFDAESATERLTTADDQQHITTITEVITVCELEATAVADRKQTDALRHTARLEAAREALENQKDRHQQAIEDANTASDRHSGAVGRLAADLQALPVHIQAMLPEEAIEVRADAAAAAATTVATHLSEIQRLVEQLETVREEKAEVLTQQRALDHEARTTMEQPLDKLHAALNDWAQAVEEAINHLGTRRRHRRPQAPADYGIAGIRLFATELSKIAETLGCELGQASAIGTARADAALSNLREKAAEVADVDGFQPSDLTVPHLLHPLVAAAAKAAAEAEGQRREQHRAERLIKPAADLDAAIAAGKARCSALELLRKELVDAKFLGHLTMLRTRALLGVASDLLGQLTDQRFGFADGFEIISRGSGVVHHPNRLSGGEKFLASLALALALAELHSRSGPRLGSLFLDEGFATLDTTALESALDVLRSQVGGDRLVMVISHLHAVAEGVDDVLWVENGPAGSTARWMTQAERDELVQADLSSGLQTLA